MLIMIGNSDLSYLNNLYIHFPKICDTCANVFEVSITKLDFTIHVIRSQSENGSSQNDGESEGGSL